MEICQYHRTCPSPIYMPKYPVQDLFFMPCRFLNFEQNRTADAFNFLLPNDRWQNFICVKLSDPRFLFGKMAMRVLKMKKRERWSQKLMEIFMVSFRGPTLVPTYPCRQTDMLSWRLTWVHKLIQISYIE